MDYYVKNNVKGKYELIIQFLFCVKMAEIPGHNHTNKKVRKIMKMPGPHHQLHLQETAIKTTQNVSQWLIF